MAGVLVAIKVCGEGVQKLPVQKHAPPRSVGLQSFPEPPPRVWGCGFRGEGWGSGYRVWG